MEEEFAPVFVKITDYKDILDITDIIKKKIKDARETLQRIKDIKDEEDKELLEWGQSIDEMTEKVDFITKALFEPNV
jgi:hypothetical protein